MIKPLTSRHSRRTVAILSPTRLRKWGEDTAEPTLIWLLYLVVYLSKEDQFMSSVTSSRIRSVFPRSLAEGPLFFLAHPGRGGALQSHPTKKQSETILETTKHFTRRTHKNASDTPGQHQRLFQTHLAPCDAIALLPTQRLQPVSDGLPGIWDHEGVERCLRLQGPRHRKA